MSKKQSSKRSMGNTSCNPLFQYFDDVSLKTDNHKDFYRSLVQGDDTVVYGYAGSGKTYISLHYALREIKERRKSRIIIIRSAVPTRDVGFLSGDLDEKLAVYETPYIKIVNDLLCRGDAYEVLKKRGDIVFLSSSYLRGLTFDDAFVIVDECQNYTWHELDTIYTRIGINTQIAFVGDYVQMDNGVGREGSGFNNLIRLTSELKNFSQHNFTTDDIVRSEKIKNWIIHSRMFQH